MRSTIFTTHTSTTIKPRPDATIRVRYYPAQPGAQIDNNEYRSVQLLEFHPDWDNRAKFRSVAYVKPEDWMEHSAYTRLGEGYLEQPYVSIREFMIHEDDRQELMKHSAEHAKHGAIIVHPCPLPFPLFAKKERVITVEYKRDEGDLTPPPGQLGTTTEKSSPGGMTTVAFDDPECNKGHDGRIYPAISIPSIALRTAGREQR
ncbi:MAG TPA: hypothetical protein VHV10_20670 [Ktedonobacteraceae bacterium]|jgi:hypothetical protein|nr:hypothetical protein [Ktedonobacteraceae bacterium]